MIDAMMLELKNGIAKFMTRQLFVLLFIGMVTLFPGLSFAVEAILADDAYTYSGLKTTRYGAQAILSVKGASGTTLKKSFLKFDLSTVPAGTTGADVQKATLKLYVYRLTTWGSLDILKVTGEWDEATITDQTAPPVDGVVATGVRIDQGKIFVTVDLTNLVMDWLNGTIRITGLLFCRIHLGSLWTLTAKKAVQRPTSRV